MTTRRSAPSEPFVPHFDFRVTMLRYGAHRIWVNMAIAC